MTTANFRIRPLAVLLVLGAVVLVAISVLYYTQAVDKLPSFFPRHSAARRSNTSSTASHLAYSPSSRSGPYGSLPHPTERRTETYVALTKQRIPSVVPRLGQLTVPSA